MSEHLRVVRIGDVSPQPWVNGAGTTRELLRAEDGVWRVSLADIDRDGPFSTFPGRQRLLTVVEGAVLALEVYGDDHVIEPRRPSPSTARPRWVRACPRGPCVPST